MWYGITLIGTIDIISESIGFMPVLYTHTQTHNEDKAKCTVCRLNGKVKQTAHYR